MNTEYHQTIPDNLIRHPLIPRPRNIEETGLSEDFIAELICKHLHANGIQDLLTLSEQMALSGNIVGTVLDNLRKQNHIETKSAAETETGIRYALTDKGTSLALKASSRSGYVGPTPVTIELYTRVIQAQSVKNCKIDKENTQEAFSDVTVNKDLLNQLGPAMHSGRAIMIYGLPGTGKTYICKKLTKLLGDSVYIPYAIAVGESVITYYDPLIHKPISDHNHKPTLKLHGHDPRFIPCFRPTAVSGGELTLDMLEIDHDPVTRLSQAPLQLKANNGMYIIDDLGRQRVPPIALFNRWIVPLEEKHDYLTLDTGKRFQVPFDVILIFSTNINPGDLADDAFLRRLGYKIKFAPLTEAEFREIWALYCKQLDINCPNDLLESILEMYKKEKRPLLPCHPRDLLGLVSDLCHYENDAGHATIERLRLAWESYFINIENEKVAE